MSSRGARVRSAVRRRAACDRRRSGRVQPAAAVRGVAGARCGGSRLIPTGRRGGWATGRRFRRGEVRTSLQRSDWRDRPRPKRFELRGQCARRFDVSRRRHDLTFQHHAEVCALPDNEQECWLDRAAVGRWSRNELRRRIRGAGGDRRPAEGFLRLAVDPGRQARWREAAQRSDSRFEAWVLSVVDTAADAAMRSSATVGTRLSAHDRNPGGGGDPAQSHGVQTMPGPAGARAAGLAHSSSPGVEVASARRRPTSVRPGTSGFDGVVHRTTDAHAVRLAPLRPSPGK